MSEPEENTENDAISLKEDVPSQSKTQKRSKKKYSQQCRGMKGIARF